MIEKGNDLITLNTISFVTIIQFKQIKEAIAYTHLIKLIEIISMKTNNIIF